MQKRKIVCILMLLCAVIRVSAQDSYRDRVKRYIDQYKDWAIEEQRRSGVPAAITLAQGIHETSAGNSELALHANNHFGIKCKTEWNGETYAYTDDAPDECFRKYPSAFQSYKDHSDFLTGSKRYASLFKLPATDYSGWAKGLKRCGYATNPRYAQVLITLVEDFNLQDFTLAALDNSYNPVKDAGLENEIHQPLPPDVNVPEEKAVSSTVNQAVRTSFRPAEAASSVPAVKPAQEKRSGLSVSYEAPAEQKKKTDEKPPEEAPLVPQYGKLVKVNGLKAFYAKKGTVLLHEAFKYNIRYAKLLEINDLPDAPLEADMYIYLEKKNARGQNETYTVGEGETLIQIAQKEGIQLKYLKYYNRINANEEPVAGSVLQLQKYADSKPLTYVKDQAPASEPAAVFAGSVQEAIPQGATRKRASYIYKRDLEDGKEGDPEKEQAETARTPEPSAVAREEPVKSGAAGTDDPEAMIIPEPEAMIGREEAKPGQPSGEAETRPVNETEKPVLAETPQEQAAEEKNESPDWVKTEPLPMKAVPEDLEISAAPEEITRVPEPAPEDTVEAEKEENAPVANAAENEIPAEKENPAVSKPIPVIQEAPQGPVDEFAKLKAKLDKVVYASDRIPEAGASEKPAGKKAEEAAPEKPEDKSSPYYTVKKGDTAFSIAKRHNISMRQLMEWNKLDFNTIKVGQQLRVK